MKRIPKRLRVGQLVLVEWLDATKNDLEEGTCLPPVRVKTVGWVWERGDKYLTIHSEVCLSGSVAGDVRDATTVPVGMLRRVGVLFGVGET